MSHWLVKSEPEAYSFSQLVKDKKTAWTGVRNYTARNFLKDMAKGDKVFFYHSVIDKAVVGLATVSKRAYPDPTMEPGEKGDWVCVELKAGQALPRPVTLEEMKVHPGLKKLRFIRQPRLSVSPLTDQEAALLLKMAGL